MALISDLILKNAQRWDKMKLDSNKTFVIAERLCNQKDRYSFIAQGVKKAVINSVLIPWPVIAVIHEREAGGKFDRQLSQGDPLNRRSTHVPKGRGPFFNHANDPPGEDAFYRGCLDALIDCPPYAVRWKDWSIGGALTLLERYNGLGYANRGTPSPYIWSGTNQYISGKYVRDGVYRADVKDRQEGCAGLLFCMMKLDSTIKFGENS